MKTYKINPKVTEVDYSVVVPASELESLGWVFDTKKEGLDIRLSFSSNSDGVVKCFWAFYIDGADCEDSGDEEKSIEDLLFLLNNEVVSYNSNNDYSVSEDTIFTNWLLEI